MWKVCFVPRHYLSFFYAEPCDFTTFRLRLAVYEVDIPRVESRTSQYHRSTPYFLSPLGSISFPRIEKYGSVGTTTTATTRCPEISAFSITCDLSQDKSFPRSKSHCSFPIDLQEERWCTSSRVSREKKFIERSRSFHLRNITKRRTLNFSSRAEYFFPILLHFSFVRL